jgi:hypothetical protein
MAMPGSIQDREYQKFVETTAGNTAVRVLIEEDLSTVVIGTKLSIYSQSTAVAIGATTTIYTYTVPVGKKTKILLADVSASVVSKLYVEKNLSNIYVKRIGWATDYNVRFYLDNEEFIAGDVIKFKADNTGLSLGEFDVTISGVEYDA